MSGDEVIGVWPTRELAFAEAAAELATTGGTVFLHDPACATGRGTECDCTPEIRQVLPPGATS
jgi:hypothetical protein